MESQLSHFSINIIINSSIMKIVSLFLLGFCLPYLNFAQSEKDSASFKKLMLNDQFAEGTVLMKSGGVEDAVLNYDTDNQNIVFLKDGKYMFLAGTELIDTVYIANKKFIPVKDKMYEVVVNGEVALLIEYNNKKHPVQATTDYNGSSKKELSRVSNTVTDTYTNKLYKSDYDVLVVKSYWIKKDNSLYKANSAKQFAKPFSSKMQNLIDQFVEINQINFNDEKDLIKLVDYCNGRS